MDVVRLDKFKEHFLLKSFKPNEGQSAVEYIMLLAVISALTFTVMNNTRFKDFVKGRGLFESMIKGIEYSYRYGRDLKNPDDYQRGMNFEYKSKEHDTYWNNEQNDTRFFTGTGKYPQ